MPARGGRSVASSRRPLGQGNSPCPAWPRSLTPGTAAALSQLPRPTRGPHCRPSPPSPALPTPPWLSPASFSISIKGEHLHALYPFPGRTRSIYDSGSRPPRLSSRAQKQQRRLGLAGGFPGPSRVDHLMRLLARATGQLPAVRGVRVQGDSWSLAPQSSHSALTQRLRPTRSCLETITNLACGSVAGTRVSSQNTPKGPCTLLCSLFYFYF